MAMAQTELDIIDGSKDMTNDELREILNSFASEFNNSDFHDRVLCFEFIEDDRDNELKRKAECVDKDGKSTAEDKFNSLVFTSEGKAQTDETKDQWTLNIKRGKVVNSLPILICLPVWQNSSIAQ